MNQEAIEVGKRIKRRREQRNLSQEALAKMIGKTRTVVTGYESGEVMPPGLVVKQLAEALGTTADFLLGLTDNPEREGGEFDNEVRMIARKIQNLDRTERRELNIFLKYIHEREEEGEK